MVPLGGRRCRYEVGRSTRPARAGARSTGYWSTPSGCWVRSSWLRSRRRSRSASTSSTTAGSGSRAETRSSTRRRAGSPASASSRPREVSYVWPLVQTPITWITGPTFLQAMPLDRRLPGARPRADRALLRLRDRVAHRRTPARVLGRAPLGRRAVRGDPALRRALPREVDRAVPPAGSRPDGDARLPLDGARARCGAPRRALARRRAPLGRRPRRARRGNGGRAEASQLPLRRRRGARVPRGAAVRRQRRVPRRARPEHRRRRVLEGPRASATSRRSSLEETRVALGQRAPASELRPLRPARLDALARADGRSARVLLERTDRPVGPARRSARGRPRAPDTRRGPARRLAGRVHPREGLRRSRRASRRTRSGGCSCRPGPRTCCSSPRSRCSSHGSRRASAAGACGRRRARASRRAGSPSRPS